MTMLSENNYLVKKFRCFLIINSSFIIFLVLIKLCHSKIMSQLNQGEHELIIYNTRYIRVESNLNIYYLLKRFFHYH